LIYGFTDARSDHSQSNSNTPGNHSQPGGTDFKIILCDSYGYGTARPESAVDVLAVMDTRLSELEQAGVICREIAYRFGLDVVVYTPQRLAQRFEWGDSFMKEIVQRRVNLYESANN
jgi:hypothetical protein